MDSVIAICLTLSFVFIFLQINNRIKKQSITKIVHSQSTIHNIIKDIVPKEIFDKPEVVSQSSKHAEKNMIRVIFIDNMAYWVKDNIFYSAKTINGDIVDDTTKPVDTQNMSKKELDKMLFILDNLKRGKSNDSGGSRN